MKLILTNLESRNCQFKPLKILRENNFDKFRISKTDILNISGFMSNQSRWIFMVKIRNPKIVISNHSDFTWNQFGRIQRLKNCHFNLSIFYVKSSLTNEVSKTNILSISGFTWNQFEEPTLTNTAELRI